MFQTYYLIQVIFHRDFNFIKSNPLQIAELCESVTQQSARTWKNTHKDKMRVIFSTQCSKEAVFLQSKLDKSIKLHEKGKIRTATSFVKCIPEDEPYKFRLKSKVFVNLPYRSNSRKNNVYEHGMTGILIDHVSPQVNMVDFEGTNPHSDQCMIYSQELKLIVPCLENEVTIE
jgi:hypothetical protein